MSIRRTAIALAAVLMTAVISAAAQQPAVQVDVDSARFQIRTTLRAFYFNLAHRDWEALAADILSAKVMASHPMPAALLSQSDRKVVPELQEDCPSDTAERVDHATITREGDWARATVPNCPPGGAADEFRLVRFERRWRIIHVDLWQELGACNWPAKVERSSGHGARHHLPSGATGDTGGSHGGVKGGVVWGYGL